MPAVSLVVSICAALVVYDVFAAASCAGVTFRFDDAHPVGQWRDVAETFNVRGLKATFAVNPAYLNSRGQVEFLRDAARGGHEIVDHTHSHAILSYVCRNKDEFDALKGDSSVAEAAPSKFRLNLRYDIDFGHPLNWRFRGKVTNGVLVVSSSVAKRLHRPDKVYSPSLGRAFGFFDAPDGHVVLRTFWTTDKAVLPDVADEEFVCVSCRAFRFPRDVLRFQARRVRSAFRRLGLPDPTAWAQPGGWEPLLSDGEFKSVYVDEFGYLLGDAFVPYGATADPLLASYHNRYRSYFDNPSVTRESIRRDIKAAVSRGEPISFISHMHQPRGMSWKAWLDETGMLLDWLVAEGISVLTASELGVRLSADAATWHRLLDPPPEYSSFPRRVCKTATYARDGIRVECYEQANGPGTTQRVMVAMPTNAAMRLPAVVVPFYFPEAMLGFNPVDGTPEAPGLVRAGTNLTSYAAIAYMADLARRGYVTASADAYNLTYARQDAPTNNWEKWEHAGRSLVRDWPGWTGVGKLVFDTRLLVDLLSSHERVDSSRIGIIGHSLGGKMAFYAGCLDPRIKVIVASDFGIGWEQTNWGDIWYWGERLADMRGRGRTNADLLSLSGGKPFCLIAGKYDNEESGRIMRSAAGYSAHPDWLKLVNHASGHRPPPSASEAGFRFLDRFLKLENGRR